MPLRYTFTWFDYTIFSTTLACSTLIGIYFGCFGNKQTSPREYILAGRKMKILPTALSITVSHFSSLILLAAPADVFRYGSGIWLLALANVVMAFLAIFVYLPVLFRTQLMTVYEYVERRFDRKTKVLTLILYFFSELIKFPFYAYTASLVFSSASGLNINLVATVVGLICVFYTTIGGLKAVIWTDILQFLIVVISLVTIFSVGFTNSGGFVSVWETASQNQRLQTFNFDPTDRDAFWAYMMGPPLASIAHVIIHQTGAQKFLALPTFRHSVKALICSVVASNLVITSAVFIGLLVYSQYKDCDPLSAKKIEKHDQIMLYYVMEVAGHLPGISGLLAAALCSASISTLSSNLNAMSAVIYKDVLSAFLPEKRSAQILKLTVFTVGALGTCLIFALAQLKELFSMFVAASSVTDGPFLGIFTLGILCSKANSEGAFYGAIVGFGFGLWLTISSKYYTWKGLIKYPTKPLSVDGCNFSNQIIIWSNATLQEGSTLNVPIIFRISVYYTIAMVVGVTIILGILISYFTKKDTDVERSLLSPVCDRWVSKKTKTGNQVSYSSIDAALQEKSS